MQATVLKWHGGKAYLAKRIIALMPPRCQNPNKPDPADPGWLHYVEPFAGGLSVLLANDSVGISEVVNDLNKELTNFWRVLQNEDYFAQFSRIVEAVPFSETEYANAQHWAEHDAPRLNMPRVVTAAEIVGKAVNFFIACRQSLAGRMKGFTGITSTRTRRGMNNEVSAWLSAVEGLPAVHARLKRVLVLNRDALEVIRSEDGPRTLFYLDPPYMHETRATTGEYAHEMTEQQHRDLLGTLIGIQGRFLLSGYHSKLYDVHAKGHAWVCHEFDLPNHAAGGKDKRRMTECVWTNY